MQIEDSYPLSPVQHGMLIHSLSAPQAGLYVQQLVCVLREKLNVLVFRQAWERIIQRHPILRTSFFWDGADEPLQQVYRDVSLPFEYHDWSHWPADRRDELLESFLQNDRERGFRFAEAPLMRQTLLRCAEAEYRWIWTSHHALLDGRSRLLLVKELFAFYESLCRGQNLRLNGTPSYRNYIDWLGNKDSAEAEGFWRSLLSGLTAPTSIAVGHSRTNQSEVVSFGKQTLRLSDKVTSALQSLGERHQLTPNTFLQGAWALLLSRYSGEADVVFGATRAVRHAAVQGVESMVGLLINTVPVRASVSSERLLLPWLKELRDQWIAMRDFEHTPLVKIQQWSQVPAGKPLFESLLVFENYQLNSILREEGEGWEKRDFHLLGTTSYPLAVVGYLGRELSLEVTYDRHRFDDAAMARMLGHVKVLLEEMVSDPARRLSDLPMLTESERHQLLVEWNDTKRDYPKDKCVHELFEAQVERSPDAVAVVFEDKQLTYRELNCRANQLAHYLKALRVGPEVLVAICVERSLEMVVGLLGILKAGGAYVPIDPTYPRERVAFILQDAKVPVLLTQQHLIENLPEHGARVVCLDRDWKIISREKEDNPVSTTSANNLAYVMYTSGSTGRPKGVSVIHRGVVRLVKGTNYAELTEKEVFLQFAPLSFDASTFEIWAPLLNGAKLVVFPPHTPSLKELGQVIRQSHVTTLWLTSALFQLMVQDHIESLSGVKQLLAGGDVLSLPHVKRVLKQLPGCRLINAYGPTENTTFTCCYSMTFPEQVGDSVSIGTPIANTQVYILDSHLNPVPIGVSGELCIGGDGLARGYFNHPELAAEKFIPHPFSNEPGARLYKTGDLARYFPDGTIEFLGRMDHQVKIRGYRIELGEIETILEEHSRIGQAVVVGREETRGDKRLVGYVVPNGAPAPDTSELRSFVQRKLPDYMVPSAFVFLDALPLTPSGKVDRRALPALDQSRPELEIPFVAPRTPLEESMAKIWAELLKVEKVGVHDNFFALGGHSLLATQVISRVRDAFHTEVFLPSLFEKPTLAGFAEAVTEAQNQRAQQSVAAISPAPRRFQRFELT